MRSGLERRLRTKTATAPPGNGSERASQDQSKNGPLESGSEKVTDRITGNIILEPGALIAYCIEGLLLPLKGSEQFEPYSEPIVNASELFGIQLKTLEIPSEPFGPV
ncbi:hypothetical protein [Peribacillus sp. SCS-37]|uniref:hypothetical protein n=1 Tax=Paraperibacillus esterisolvens TaxID=3115296 RepID=UPI0039069E8C